MVVLPTIGRCWKRQNCHNTHEYKFFFLKHTNEASKVKWKTQWDSSTSYQIIHTGHRWWFIYSRNAALHELRKGQITHSHHNPILNSMCLLTDADKTILVSRKMKGKCNIGEQAEKSKIGCNIIILLCNKWFITSILTFNITIKHTKDNSA